MPEDQDGKQQERVKSHIQKQNSITVKKKISKLFIFLSIIIPLLILGMTFYDQQNQLVQKFLGINADDQLIKSLDNAINSITQQIQTNKLEIRSFLKQKDYQELFQQKDNDKDIQIHPLRVYDTFVYNIVLLNINPKQSPLKQSLRQKLEQPVTNYFQQRSYLTKHLYSSSNKYEDANISQKLKITIQTGHISQIDQNYQQKIISFYQQQHGQQSQTKIKNTSQHYIESIMNQLQKLNRQKYCHFIESHRTWKQHTIYVFYSSQQQQMMVQKMVVDDKVDVGERLQQRMGDRRMGSYWATEDYEVNVMVLLPQYTNRLQYLLPRVEQIVYQSLGLQKIILTLAQQDNVSDKQLQQINAQNIINKYVHINIMQKSLDVLKKINDIINDDGSNNIPYQKIDSKRRKQITQMLQNIYSYEYNFINNSLINQFNKIDTFPSEYKLGALAPLAIILLYPLLTFVPYLFK